MHLNLHFSTTPPLHHHHCASYSLAPFISHLNLHHFLCNNPKYRKDWNISAANEFGRLAQGVGNRITGSDTIRFIPLSKIPYDRLKNVTYGKFVCELKPNKKEINRTRLTVGGDRINYPGDCGTPTADLVLIKTHLNSVISTKGARFMTVDIKNFYLNTPMTRPEYVRLKLSDIPDEITHEYKLHNIATPEGYVYIEVNKGMYGLPQAGILAQELLEKRLNQHGYFQSHIVPGFWKHADRPISFTLVVDDFGIKYVGKQHAQHLISVLKEHYEIEEDWSGSKYIGLTIDWDYGRHQLHISMPKYVSKAMKRFNHSPPQTAQSSPYPHTRPNYGAKVQYSPNADTSPLLDKQDAKFIQGVTGTFLYYARAVDPTLLTSLSAIAATQSKPTENTMKNVRQFLDYVASQEDAVITYRASDMILSIHSDAGYCNEPHSRSRAGGHFYLSSDAPFPPNNGAILNISQIIKAVMSSAAEAELGALYINAKEAVHIRQMLREMGHPQPRTPIQTDNSTAEGVINSKIQPKRTKAMDMRYFWLKDREAQDQFRFFWRAGATNLADYWTKHHPGAHHRNMRKEFLTTMHELTRLKKEIRGGPEGQLQGCVGQTAHASRVLQRSSQACLAIARGSS
jgi:hypothetical protein